MNFEYEAPRVSVAGSVESLTAGGRTGNFLDATFPVGTPFSQLTFS